MKLINELLLKAHATGETKILCHYGFRNNCNLTQGEAEFLQNFAIELKEENAVYITNDICFAPFITGYNGSNVLAGIEIKKIKK